MFLFFIRHTQLLCFSENASALRNYFVFFKKKAIIFPKTIETCLITEEIPEKNDFTLIKVCLSEKQLFYVKLWFSRKPIYLQKK